MVKVFETVRFGKIEIEEEKIIEFPSGLLGLTRYKHFFILDHSENSPFKWLQSGDDPALAFVIIDPLNFMGPEYLIEPSLQEVQLILDKEEDQIVTAVIVTIPQDAALMTANLRAPLLINMSNNKGMQYVILDKEWPIRYEFLKDLKEKQKETKDSGEENKSSKPKLKKSKKA